MTDGRTHYDECWRTRGHHDCAIAEIGRLTAEISDERLKHLASEGQWIEMTGRLREALARYMAAFPHEHALNAMAREALRGVPNSGTGVPNAGRSETDLQPAARTISDTGDSA